MRGRDRVKSNFVGEERHLWDTQAQIQMCLNCPLDECINCLDSEHATLKDVSDSFKKIKELKAAKKKITKAERAVLEAYPLATTDYDLSLMLARNQSTVCAIRKKLGLPVIKWTNQDIRKRLVALWLE